MNSLSPASIQLTPVNPDAVHRSFPGSVSASLASVLSGNAVKHLCVAEFVRILISPTASEVSRLPLPKKRPIFSVKNTSPRCLCGSGILRVACILRLVSNMADPAGRFGRLHSADSMPDDNMSQGSEYRGSISVASIPYRCSIQRTTGWLKSLGHRRRFICLCEVKSRFC
jgi:hypothetical protein